MVEVSIQHIIGTVALIGLVITACLFYSVFTSSVQDDNRLKQLGQVSEDVALNIEEMINLAKFSKSSSDYTNYTVKVIDLPVAVGGEPYKIQLANDSSQGFHVHAFLVNRPSIGAVSTIPYNSGDIPITIETNQTVQSFSAGADNLKVFSSGTIYAKNGTAIWTNTDWSQSKGDSPNQITVGIGWVSWQQ